MPEAHINRFEWLKAVGQSDGLRDSAVRVAMALGLQFANDQTGQINPSIKTLANWTKQSTDTVKRAVRALVDAGWLVRTEGRGRGNKTAYVLCSPGKVVPMVTQNKGGTRAPLTKQKGAQMHQKGGTRAPSYIEDKQSLEQKGSMLHWYRSHHFAGNAFAGLVVVCSSDHDALYAWGRWLKKEGFPALDKFPIEQPGKKSGTSFFSLPWKRPPTDAGLIGEAREFFASMHDQENACAASS